MVVLCLGGMPRGAPPSPVRARFEGQRECFMEETKQKQVTREEWWAGLTPEEREAIWKVMRMANDLFEGEQLLIEYVGGAFVPSLVSVFRKVGEPGRTGGKIWPGTENPEAWWESRSPLSIT